MTPPPAPRKSRTLVVALWANAALLAVIAVAILNHTGGPSSSAAYAQNQPPIAGGAGIFVMPGQFKENVWGCYLLDIDNKTICAYEYFPGDKKLRLAAARSYRWDTKLEAFNTEMLPREVKSLVERQQAGNGIGAVPPPPDAPAAPDKENK